MLQRDLSYEHEVELLMCQIRMNELQMRQEFCKEEQALELYQQSKLQNMPQITPDHKRKILLDAVTWKYDCVQQYKKICFQFAEAVIGRERGKGFRNLLSILAFWCGCDEEQMDRIFRTSGLMRDKWDRKQAGSTYGAISIRNSMFYAVSNGHCLKADNN